MSINNIPQELLTSMLENPYESLILVDADGIIKFMSGYNESVYNVKIKDVIGRPIKKLIPNTRLPQVLKDKDIKISMDGKGRCMDNIFIERLWRSVKYEKIYVNEFQSVEQLPRPRRLLRFTMERTN